MTSGNADNSQGAGATPLDIINPVPTGALPQDAPLLYPVTNTTQRGEDTHDRKQNALLSSVLVWGLVVMAFAAPIPLGSNRPVAWAFWAGCIGLMLAVHLIAAQGRQFNVILQGLGLVLTFALVQPIWGLIQLVPGLGGGLALPSGAQTVLALGQDPAKLSTGSISLARDVTGLAVMRMLAHVALFLLVLRVIDRRSRAELVLKGVFFGITLHAVWAMINLTVLGDVAIWGEKTAYLGVGTGTFVNRNSFASFLGMGLILGVVLLMDRLQRRRMNKTSGRIVFSADSLALLVIFLCGWLIFVALLSTQSRAGLATSLVGAGAALVVMARAGSVRAQSRGAAKPAWMGRILVGIGAIFVLVALAQSATNGVIERGLFASADWSLRGRIYENAIARLWERPLTGYGLDTFALAYEMGREGANLTMTTQVDAHSTYLENWVDGGLIFGSAMLFAGLFYLRRLWALLRQWQLEAVNGGEAASEGRPALAAAAIGVFCLAMVHSIFDFSFEIEANVMILVMILTIGVAPLRKSRSAKSKKRNSLGRSNANER